MESNFLAHYGVKGMKWGVRRYQNPDGTLTDQGRKRYGTSKKQGEVLSTVRYGRKFSETTVGKNLKLKFPKPRLFISDEQLDERMQRLTAQRQYYMLKSEISKLTRTGRAILWAENFVGKTSNDAQTVLFNAFNQLGKSGGKNLGDFAVNTVAKGVVNGVGDFVKSRIDIANKNRENLLKSNITLREQRQKSKFRMQEEWFKKQGKLTEWKVSDLVENINSIQEEQKKQREQKERLEREKQQQRKR